MTAGFLNPGALARRVRNASHSLLWAVSLTVLCFTTSLAWAASPASGTLAGNSFKLTYSGSDTTVNPANFDPTQCQTAMYCDVYTMTLNVSPTFRSAHPNFRVNIQFGWSGNTNEFDMYVYSGGAVVATSANSFGTSQLIRLEAPANGIYTIYSSQSLGVPSTPYMATITLQAAPPPITAAASSYTLDPDGKFGPQMFQFTSDQLMVATPPQGAAGQDIEPGIVIDGFGNIYISAIEGVPSGSDAWVSKDFGNTFTYLGQPDHAAGGGDEDIALGVPFVGDTVHGDSTGRFYYSSLNLADIYLATATDMGTTFIPGDSPAKVVDRMWLAGAGTEREYMVTVQLGAALSGTDTLIVTQSDDGGLTFPNGALVSQALLNNTPETGFHSNIVAYPGVLGGATANSAVYTTFTDASAVDLYVASCPAPCNLPALPKSGLPGNQSFTSVLAFTAPPGATLGNVFTPIAVDNDGSLFVAFSTEQFNSSGVQTGQNVYLIHSVDGGKTWSKGIQMNNPADPNTATSMLPWLSVGDHTVGIFWYGTDVVGDPNNQTVFATAKWKIYYALVNTALKTPNVQYVVASGTATGTADKMAGVVHYGSICTKGTNCDISMPAGNRELAEYAEVAHDPMGLANIVFSEDSATTTSAFTWYTKQTAGPGMLPNVGSGAGNFAILTGSGYFGFNIEGHNQPGTQLREGTLNYEDTSKHILLTGNGGFSFVHVGASIVATGAGTLQDGSTVTFTITATPGGPGTGSFAIAWTGYSASGTLVQGQILP